MKSTKYFSYSKSSIGFKRTTCSATRDRIPPTATAKSSLDSANDQSSSYITATCSPSKTVGSLQAGRDLVVPRPADGICPFLGQNSRDLAPPRPERSDPGGLVSDPSPARIARFRLIGRGNVLKSFLPAGFRPIGRGNVVESFLRE